MRTSEEAGMLWDFELPGVGDNLAEMEKNARSRMDWLWDYDISEDMERARAMMDRED